MTIRVIILTPLLEAYLRSITVGTADAERITGKSRWSINRQTKGLSPPLRNVGSDGKTLINLYCLIEWHGVIKQIDFKAIEYDKNFGK